MDKNSKNEATSKTKTKTKSASAESATSTGKLGGYEGHSITSVIRAFGKAGWTLDESRAFFAREKIAVADTTIKIQLREGKLGRSAPPADFSKNELAAMKPKVAAAKTEAKPAAKKDAAKKPVKKVKTEEEAEAEADAEEEEKAAAKA